MDPETQADPTTTTATGAGTQPGVAGSSTVTPAATGAGAAAPVVFTPEQQAKVDAIVQQAKKDAAGAEQRKQRDEAARKAGEFEQLYNEQAAEVERLKKIEQQYTALCTVVEGQIQDRLKKLPEALRPPMPDDMPITTQLEWVERVAAYAAKAQDAGGVGGKPPPPGNGPSPKPGNAGAAAGTQREQLINQVQNSGMYNRF